MNQALRSIHVVAGVIVDARGRVLLGRRKMDSDQPGLWEFPGGKLEPGETSEQALVRELREELGIEVQAIGERLIEVPQLYPDKRLRLEVRRVLAWQGTPRGREGQALTWVAQDKLQTYSMPPADVPVVSALLHPDRYLVTPTPQGDGNAWLAGIARALALGITRVHLRQRGLEAVQWRELAAQAVALCRKADADVLVNADVSLARELGAGVHLQAAQLATLEDRPLPADTLVAASCHDASQLQVAQRIGCDFAVVGSVNATPSHPGVAPIGWDGFVALRETVALPLYAIGGLSPLDIGQARQQGAQGVAAIRAFWED